MGGAHIEQKIFNEISPETLTYVDQREQYLKKIGYKYFFRQSS